MRRSMLLDRQLHPVATLDSMIGLSYELKHNDLCTAEIRIAASDPCAALCTAYAAAHLWDGERDLGVYRVSGSPASDMWEGGTIAYSLEHMLSTLLDDVIFGTLTLTDRPFADAIRDLLGRQSEARWVLGDCDFDAPITQDVGNETILSAIRKLCGLLQEEYTWDYDTSVTPFVLHIRRADTDACCGIHYGRNMTAITRQMDASSVVTRLYLLGGAGTDGKQVDVTTLTDGSVPWIDADTIAQWGIRASIYQNGEITDPAQLLEKGRAIMEARKNPRYTYQATAIDLYQLTGYAWDRYDPGKLVMVTDDDHGVRFSARIVSVAKQDATGDPGSVTVTIANEQEDELGTINTMASMLQSVQSSGIGTAAAQFRAQNQAAGMKTQIDQNAQEILLRATWEAHNALGDRMLQAESSISVQADGIAALSGRTTSLEGTVTEVSAQLRVNNDAIGALVTRTETVEGRVSSAEAAITVNADAIAARVKQDDYNTYVSQTAQQIALKASQGDLDAAVLRLDAAEGSITAQGKKIDAQAEEIALKASNLRVDAIETTISGLVKVDELNSALARIGTLESNSITATTLSAALASLDAVNLSGSLSANGVQAQYGDFTNANIANVACKKSTLTIGDKSCTFFAPDDATFDLSDMPGYDDALAAARTEGASSVTITSMGWQGSSNTVRASNGKEIAVALPAFTASGGDSFTAAHTTTVYFYTASVQGYLASREVDASSVYDAGYQAARDAYYDSRYQDGYDDGVLAGYDNGYAAGYQAARDAVRVEGGITSITNPAQGYYMAKGWAAAKLDGNQIDYTTFSKSQQFS